MRAAIDIGSNSILLTISQEPQPRRRLNLVYDDARVVGLAKGLSPKGDIDPQRVQKALACLKDYKKVIQSYEAENALQVVATEGLRRARNGLEVKAQLEEALDHPIELISGQREAELSFWGVEHEFPSPDTGEEKIVFDIGGASTEVVYGDQTGVKDYDSLKIGCVVLSEAFLLHSAAQPESALKEAESVLAQSSAMRTMKEQMKKGCAYGVAGTMTTLLAIDRQLQNFKRSEVHGKTISQQRVETWLKRILSLSLEDRKKIPGMPPDRADVFGGGLVILMALMHYFDWNEVICSDSGVRLGLLYQMGPTPK